MVGHDVAPWLFAMTEGYIVAYLLPPIYRRKFTLSMKPFFGERSLHTWLGTVASIISIAMFLTGIQSIYQVGSISVGEMNFSWGRPSLGVTIALLVLNLVFVWGAYWIISTTIIAKAKTYVLFKGLVEIVTWGIGFAIGIWNFDAFFNFETLLLDLETHFYFSDFLILILLVPFMCLVMPTVVTLTASGYAEEWGCGQCGRVALEFIDSFSTGRSEDERYVKNENGLIQSYRIEKFDNYVVTRGCKRCGAKWDFNKRESLGYIDYPLEEDDQNRGE